MYDFHDYHIIGYSIDGVTRQAVLRMWWPFVDPTDIQHADVIFTGVQDYFLEHDLGDRNILYSIDQTPVEQFVAENADKFNDTRKWGWPTFWDGNAEEATAKLRTSGVNCYLISGSIGLDGWVLATGVHHVKREA